MTKLLIANWKSNPHDALSAVKLAKSVDKKGVVITPPYPFLEQVGKVIKYAELGAQDVFWEDVGPYTGEISWRQLKYLKVKYVIIGHSERRRYLAETDELINKKVKAALSHGLKVVLCVGEPKRELRIKNYELEIRKAKNYVKKQIEKDLKGIHNSLFKIHNSLIIAYEPVWAVSSEKGSKPDTPEDAVEMIKFIKEILNSFAKGESSSGGKFHILNSKVLYGGSVTAKNARGFLVQKDIDGALVGGASLDALEFNRIISNII